VGKAAVEVPLPTTPVAVELTDPANATADAAPPAVALAAGPVTVAAAPFAVFEAVVVTAVGVAVVLGAPDAVAGVAADAVAVPTAGECAPTAAPVEDTTETVGKLVIRLAVCGLTTPLGAVPVCPPAAVVAAGCVTG